ncbi:hypothetical protein QFC22_001626 [Naganishia vaughanmartiniae]|uniref:Uncharacterized protein n=1 Tax=Naganishia vaughanmartiniae TaxID=1424756 RepID=A0ACC2XJ30_9TREE|nr:hypothetical protein QFC22_001626 [Naganishia vaughanmartiniae]
MYKPSTAEEDSPSSRTTKTKAQQATKHISVKAIKERDINQNTNPFDVDDSAKPPRVSAASTDSATTVSPDTPTVGNKSDDKENVAVGNAVNKKDNKATVTKLTGKTAEKVKAIAPPVIVIGDSDEDEDEQGMSLDFLAGRIC